MKKILFICFSLIITISLSVLAGNVYIQDKVDRMDSVTGPGNTVIQHSDGTTSYHHKDIPRRKVLRRDIPHRESPKKARSIGDKIGQFCNFSCIDWNDRRRDLRFDRGMPISKTKEAYELIVYVKGLLDAHKLPFDNEMISNIDAKCTKHSSQKLVTVVGLMKRWRFWPFN